MSQENSKQSGESKDPLASLHRMSTTAGAASQEYVAINLFAVAAAILGVASGLAMMARVMIVIPIAAIVIGLAALRQIRNSNGTQTGQGLAATGIILAVIFSGTILVRGIRTHLAVSTERAAIEQVVGRLDAAVKKDDVSAVLSLFSDGFLERKKLTEQAFAQKWRGTLQPGMYGAVTSITTNGLIELGEEEAGSGGMAASMLLIQFEKSDHPMRRDITFRKSGGEWKINDIEKMFPDPEVQQQQQKQMQEPAPQPGLPGLVPSFGK